MDKIKKYQNILKKTLEKQANINIANMPKVKSTLIIDKDKKHYILLDIGWNNDEFIHDWVFHFELKGSKIYGHKNMTDFDIVAALIENGIDKKDIIISVLEEPTNLSESQLGEAA